MVKSENWKANNDRDLLGFTDGTETIHISPTDQASSEDFAVFFFSFLDTNAAYVMGYL